MFEQCGSPAVTMPVAIPGRVQAAMNFLHFAEMRRNPPPSFDGMRSSEPRELSPMEERVYSNALKVLSDYFTGEMDYGDTAPVRPEPRDGDGPPKVPVTT